MIAPFQTYLLALTAALYLLRGMLELPTLGWRFEVQLTTVIGVLVLPALAGLSAADVGWGQWLILTLSVLGCMVNVALLVRLWRGFSLVAALTIAISTAYSAIVILALL